MSIFEVKYTKKLRFSNEFESNVLVLYLNTKYRIKKKVLKEVFLQSRSIEEYRELLSVAASKSLFNFWHKYNKSTFDIGNSFEINEVRQILNMPKLY